MKMCSFFLTLLSYSFLLGQKIIVKLEVNQKKAQVGKEIIVTVKSNVEGIIDIDFPSQFVQGYNVMNGMEQAMDYATGSVYTIFYFSQNGAFRKEGTYIIGPAYIKKGRKVYKSNTISIDIEKELVENTNGAVSSKQMKQAAFGIIECNKTELFEGEPLVVNAKICSRYPPTRIEDYQAYKIEQSLDKHPLNGASQLTAKKETIKGTSMYTIQHDRNVIFPSGNGNVQINPFKLILRQNYDGIPVISTGSEIRVKSLPPNAPKSFIGMVGNLEASAKFNGKCEVKGDILNLEIILKGAGNLHNADVPKLLLPKGLMNYGSPKIEEDFTFTAKGCEGRVTITYAIQSKNNDQKIIKRQAISYFDPVKAEYITVYIDGLTSKMASLSSPVAENNQTQVIQKKTSEPAKRLSTKNTKPSFPWLAFSIGCLFVISISSFLILKKTKPSHRKAIKANASTPQQTWIGLENEAHNIIESGTLEKCDALLLKAISLKVGNTMHVFDKSKLMTLFEEKFPHFDSNKLTTLFSKLESAKYGMNNSEMSQIELSKEVHSLFRAIKNA